MTDAKILVPEENFITDEPFYQPVGDEIAIFEAAYANDLPVLLKGPTGCGKSRFVEHMAYKLGKPLITVACNEDMTASDLVGRYLLDSPWLGVSWLIWGVCLRTVLVYHGTWFVNSAAHTWGYRNYESADAARNILPWGILIGGEELHNNHHAFPSSAKLSSKWWEFDIGWMYIRLWSALGLARVKKVAPTPRIIVGKDVVDMDTLRAVVVSRMHVLARYAQEVLMPVSSSELCKSELSCRKLKRRARKLLLQREGSLDRAARRSLKALLEQSQALETVYQYRQRLREVWEKTASSQENLLQSLQEWVRQAEASGVRALEEFARTLRGYSLPEGPALVR